MRINIHFVLTIAMLIGFLPEVKAEEELCSPRTASLHSQISGLRKDFCQQNYKDNLCDDFFNAHPELNAQRMNCEEDAKKSEGLMPRIDLLRGCAVGGAKGGFDSLVAIFTFPATMLDQLRTGFDKGQALKAQKELFYKNCMASSECISALYQQHYHESPSAEVIENYKKHPTTGLISRLHSMAQDTAFKDHRDEIQKIMLESKSFEEAQAKIAKVIPNFQKTELENGFSMIEAKAKEIFNKYECANSETQSEMRCYALAALLAPGTAIKGGKALVAFRSKKSLELAAAELSTQHWAAIPSSPQVSKEIVINAYKDVYKKTNTPVEAGKQLAVNLPDAPSSSMHAINFDAQTTAEINRWAQSVLKVAQDAHPNESLKIKNVSVSPGWDLGKSRIHFDVETTYLHGTSTLPGQGAQSTWVFLPSAKAKLKPTQGIESRVTAIQPDGKLTITQSTRDKVVRTLTLDKTDYVAPATDQTVMFSGTGHRKKVPSKEVILHSSPFQPGTVEAIAPFDRITFFISIWPK